MNFTLKESAPAWGTQVYPTKESVRLRVNKANDLGIFLGMKDHDLIWVVKHDKHTVYSYDKSFWTTNTFGWKG